MYILEGNIGVGKSTFLSLVKKHIPTIEVVTEPVEDWSKQIYGQSLLENFYKDTPRWAYTLETLTMMCRVRNHIEAQEHKNPNRILERSVYSGHYCFAVNDYKMGVLNDMEWNIYNKWVDFLIHDKCKLPLGFIYLQAEPNICFERVIKRNRSSEGALSLDYMKSLHHCHQKFLIEKKDVVTSIKNIPVLVLDCNQDFVDNPKNMDLHMNKLQNFLQETQCFSSLNHAKKASEAHN